ncbi:MAG TPA: 4-hydroxy-tetrahydrodipicolinate reductase [Candidatus Spyradenecus faecavium]|uniref:4-hydroxy-tetrahydrodipicolinate reductase n=1 Tax=Candidatus Spyradenecus faecavium TaxID=2840947 RepID=A0A9D1NMA5_9BACT|nr:4-hydroxy-tetrahydrodipicolinate reductase [Candidatus Spyradenecus faecavium]
MKLAILGGAGRMGQMLLANAKDLGLDVVAVTEIPDSPLIGQPAAPGLVYQADWPTQADTVIDFTFHACVIPNLQNAVANRQAYVLGTTGLTPEERAAVDDAATRIPLCFAPNFSLGVNLLLGLVRRAAEVLDDSYDAEIVEMHHRHKKDAPSGTALGLAQALAQGRGVNLDDEAIYGRHGIVGERPRGQIAVHALRGGSVVGDHTVIFAADEERVELTHKASSRAAFAKGALKAAQWLQGRDPGLYDMADVLGF